MSIYPARLPMQVAKDYSIIDWNERKRIRRAVLCAFLGITREFALEKSAYIRVLGMNARGKEILAAADSALPIDTSLKALSKTSRNAARQANFTSKCTDIWQLALEKPGRCGEDFTTPPIILE